jgi:hypothetical protein
MVPLWREFAQHAASESRITILESRLWQNTALSMLLSEVSNAEFIDFNHQVGEALSPLSPSLIYLDQTDVDAALHRMAATRGEAWVQSTLQETLDYPWFASRGIHDFDGWVSFFMAWQKIAEWLFLDWPHRKIRVLNPHENWDKAYETMVTYLQVE